MCSVVYRQHIPVISALYQHDALPNLMALAGLGERDARRGRAGVRRVRAVLGRRRQSLRLTGGRGSSLVSRDVGGAARRRGLLVRSEEHTSELQFSGELVFRVLLEKTN